MLVRLVLPVRKGRRVMLVRLVPLVRKGRLV